MKILARAGLASLSCVTFAACGGPPAPAPAARAPAATTPAAPAAACGVTVFAGDYDPFCQKTLDDTCCAQEKTCAGDPACKELLARVNACPLRHGKETEDCVAKLLPQKADTPGYSMLNAIATCSKRIPPSGDRCIWPD